MEYREFFVTLAANSEDMGNGLFRLLMLCCLFGMKQTTVAALDLNTRTLKIQGDGKSICTNRLQEAIDRIGQAGGGRLTITAGDYLTGTLIMRSGVELNLEEGATLKGCTDPRHYITASASGVGKTPDIDNGSALIYANGAAHIALRGKGCIDGQGLQLALTIDSLHHTGEMPDPNYNYRRLRPNNRPKLFFFLNCSGVTVEGLRLQNSAEWGLAFCKCEHLKILDINLSNRAYWNNDGIDLSGCRHVQVCRCWIDAADDGICLKSHHPDELNYDIEISDCDIRSSASAIKFGTASYGDFRRIHIHDIKVSDTFRSAIAIESVDGGEIDSILVERVEAVNTGNPIFLRLGQRAGDKPGALRHVTIRHLQCQVPFGRPDEAYDLRGPEVNFFHNPFPSSICGIPGNRIQDVTIEDVEIRYPGRATKGMAYMPLWRVNDVPEQINEYPEFSMFGELPSWGFYVRHAEDITFRNVSLTLADIDFRPAFVFDDTKRVSLEHVLPSVPDQYYFAAER